MYVKNNPHDLKHFFVFGIKVFPTGCTVDDVSAQLSWNNRDEMFSGTERPTRYSVDKNLYSLHFHHEVLFNVRFNM